MADMTLSDVISRRKSVRKYADRPVEPEVLEKIRNFCADAKPLDPEIRFTAQIVDREQVRFYLPWKAPQLIAVFSEKKDGYLENVGFVFQQVDLYLQSIGLGCCWMGLGKLRQMPQVDGMEFVILLAFGYPDEPALRTGPEEFRRRTPEQIADRSDPRLEPARLAPSGTNSQPWYFTHEEAVFHAYCSEAGLLRHAMMGSINRIDMGIALGQLYVANPDTFRFFRTDTATPVAGHRYTGSFTL